MTDNTKPAIGGNDATVKPVEQLTIGEIRDVSDLPLIVTHSAPVTRVTVEAQACRTCRLWTRQMGLHWGECNLKDEEDSPVILASVGYAAYKTLERFSCAAWQPLPDADARE